MRQRPGIGVVDEEQSWRLIVESDSVYLCEVTVPHAVLEWFGSLKDRASKEEVWSDWMDYEGYDDSPKSELEQTMASHIERFLDRVSMDRIELPLSIYEAEDEAS